MSRRIAHVDLDAFYVSVELLRRPELRGLPVIVSGDGPRAVVTTASYEARRFGVGSAMPTSQARRLCPQAVLVKPDFDAYRAASRQVMAVVRAAAPVVEVMGLDEAYLDVTSLVAPKAEMRRMKEAIRRTTGLTASIGIGPNKLVAKVASDAEKPNGFVVLSREEACARFAAASPGLVPGIGPKTVERLSALGIDTLAKLAAADETLLVTTFGARHGPDLRSRAAFEHDGQVTPVRKAVSESKETTFNSDIADAAEQEAVLRRLSAQLCEALVRQGRRGRTVAIKVRLDDFTTVTRARTVAEALNDTDRVAQIAVELLREYAPARPVRLLGVRIAGFAEAGDEQQLALAV